MRLTKIIPILCLWLGGIAPGLAQVEQGAYLVTVDKARFTDGKEIQPGNPLFIARVHDVMEFRRIDFYWALMPAVGSLPIGDGRFESARPFQTTGEGWEGGRNPPPSVVAQINALKLPMITSGRIDGRKLEGEYSVYYFWWTGDKLDRHERAVHRFRGERIGVESAFILAGGGEPVTEVPYNQPVRIRVKFDRDIPGNVLPGYFTWVYLWQNRTRVNDIDGETTITTYAASGPREALSQQTFVFTSPGADGVSKAVWERPDRWHLIAPPWTAVQLLANNGTYQTLRVSPPPAPVVTGKPPPLEELERPMIRVQAAGTMASVEPGLNAVVETQPFDINVFVPAASLPKLANGRTPDPDKVPATITVRIVKEDDGETTLDLRYKGGCLYATASPITAKQGGGGSATVAGFDFSTVLGSTRLTGGIGSISVPEGGRVTVSYGGEETGFTVHDSGTRLALAAYRAAFITMKADATQKLRSGGLSEMEQLALVMPEVSDAVKTWLRSRTLSAVERQTLVRVQRACDHALVLIDGDFYVRASTKLNIAESYASMLQAGMEDKLEDGNKNPDSPSRFGFNYINDREGGALSRAIDESIEERSDPLIRLARDVAMGFYQWTLSLTWAGDATAIAGINPMTGKPLSRAERIVAVVNAAAGLATQAAVTGVTKNAMGDPVLDFVVSPGSSKPAPIAARPARTGGGTGAASAIDDGITLPPARFDNIPAPIARVNPPGDNSPTMVNRPNPAGDNSPTVVNRPNPVGDNSPTIVPRSNPAPNNAPTVANRPNPAGDNSPTVINRPNPAGDNSPTMVNRPNPAGNNAPTVVTRPNSPGDNSPTIINRPASAGDNSPTVVNRPAPVGDNSPTVVNRPASPGDNSPTIVNRPAPVGDNSPTVVPRANPMGDNPTVVGRPPAPAPAPTPAAAPPSAGNSSVPPPFFGGSPGVKVKVVPANLPTPVPTTATRAAARQGRPALADSARTEHAAKNDAALAAGRADSQARGRVARDQSLELLQKGRPLSEKETLGLREDLAALGLQESLEARVREARRAGVREDDIATAIRGVDSPGRTPVTTREGALRNLETEIVEARGYKIITPEDALAVRGATVRAMSGNASPADRDFIRGQVEQARAQGRDWFEDVGRQGTMNYHDGFVPLASPEAIAALRRAAGGG